MIERDEVREKIFEWRKNRARELEKFLEKEHPELFEYLTEYFGQKQ